MVLHVKSESSKPKTRTRATKAKVRVRRSPEEARSLILHACQDLLTRDGPDGVGLKDVADRAGVSHALVTHYFGTIDALVNAALAAYADEQRAALLERIVAHPEDGPRVWMKLFFEWISRPPTARMFAWALVTGRVESDDFFSGRQRGARRIGDAVEARFAATGEGPVDRADLDFMLLLLLAAPHGYGLGKKAFWASLGRDDAGPEDDTFFFDRLADLVEHSLWPAAVAKHAARKRGAAERPRIDLPTTEDDPKVATKKRANAKSSTTKRRRRQA